MGKSTSYLLSVLFVISVLWKEAYSNDKCSIACKGSPTTQAFLNGHKYNYGVEGTVTIFLTGADKQETSVKLLGQVAVSALGNCGHELSVQNLIISGPDGKKYQSPPGIEKPVRFSMQDGRVGSEICAEEGDTRRSLNIKRALISLLQTEQKPATQVDVFGACPTEVSFSQEGGAVLVHRTRDLGRCGLREQGRNDLITSIYNPTAEIKESQLLQSSLNVESKVNSGVPEKISATEEYLYKPFSVGENGARAKVHTKLTLTGKARAANNPSHCTEPRTIIFENPHGVSVTENNVHAVLAAVKDTAKTLNTEASSKSAGSFAQLVRILRATSKDDLMNIYNQVKNNNLEKRVFIDALLRAGTGNSIEASILILKTNSLSKIEQQVVYLSLGYARHVNNEALKAAAGLLDMHDIPKEIYLGVGALAGAYCRDHQCHDSKSDGIAVLSQKLGNKLQNCRPKTKVEEDNVVAVLKGIRSIRHLEDSLIDKLAHCVVDNNVKARVKAAALEAFHSDPCNSKLKKTALDLMKNRQLDSEIRIKAYLAVIECPCGHSANEIKNLLESEPVHQVGHFITSSLRHIRASTNPDKKLAKQHYGLISTPNKYNVDDRKYSFYRELSYNVDALGVGGSIDQTVIYSQNSFLPRSVDFNLTSEIFGHSFNILELGGRQGNLDLVIEHFLGPKGLFRSGNPQDVYDDLAKRFQESKQKVEAGFTRGRRSIKSEIDNFDKNLKAESTQYNNELDLDIYMKLFGTDAVFLSLGDGKGFDFNRAIDQLMNVINDGMNTAKHFSQELRTHLLFLDAELAYPTSTGLPLKLDLVGSATARFDVSTNFDIRQCLHSPQNAKIDIKFVPSTDIEVTGLFLVDADAITTGLKVITNLHSSTGGHLIAKVLENGRGFDLQLGLPIDKQEILTASNDLVYFTAEKGQKEKVIAIKVDAERKDYSECFDQLSELLGVTVCGELSIPFSLSGPEAQSSISKFLARYPLTGSSKIRLALEKNDLRGYHIKGVVREDQNSGKRSFELLFEAEGSKNRRTQLTGEYIYNDKEIGLQLALESPIKTLSGEISGYMKSDELALLAKAKVDADEYYAKLGFAVQGDEHRSVYKPVFEYQLAEQEKQTTAIEGRVIRECNGPVTKYTFDGISVRIMNVKDPVSVRGYISNQANPRIVDFDLDAKDYAKLKGSVKTNDISLEFRNQINPIVNFKLGGHFEFGDIIRNEIDILYGGDLNDNRNRIVFSQLLKYHMKSQDDYNMITKNKFEIAALPIVLKGDADIDPKKVDVEIEGQYMNRQAEFDLEARTQIKKQGDYSVKLTASVDREVVEVFSKRDIVSNDKSNFENYVLVKGLGKYELSGVVLHKMKPNDLNIGAIGHLKANGGGKNEDIKFDIGAIENPSMYSSHAKISGSQGDILDFLLKIMRSAASPSGQLKFILKDTIAANGQFKVTDSDGKGNGMLIIDFKNAQRKIKGDVKFVAKDPVFNADVELFLNYEKDNADKMHFSTNTKRTDKLLDSKNKFEYAGKRTELNVHTDGDVALEGKTHANVEIVLPTERCLTFKLDRDVTSNNDMYNGHAELLLSDAPNRGAGASTISYKGKAINTNLEKKLINYEGQIDLRLYSGKQLQNTFSFKNNPEGDKYKFDFKSDVTGNVLEKPVSLSASATYVDSETIIDNTYRLKYNYGDNMYFDLGGVQEVKLIGEGDKKYLDDYTVTVRLPFEKAHDIKWISTILYLQPANKEMAEYTLIESVQVNGDVYKIDANGKISPKEGSGTMKLLVPQVDPVVLDTSYKNDKEGDKMNNFVEVKAKYGKGNSASVSVDTSVAPHDSTFVIKANSPQAEKIKKLELTVNTKNPVPDTYTSTAVIDADGRVYKSETTIMLSKAHPLLDLKYTNPTNSKPSRIYVKGSSLSSTQGKVEVKLDNVQDICLDMTAEGNVQKDNVDFKVEANSNELGWKNAVAQIVSKDAGNGKRLEFTSKNDNKNVLSGSTSYISKREGQKTIIEGSGTVKIKEEQKSANFKYIRTLLTEGNEKGIEEFFNIALGERSYVAESRVTNIEYKNSHVYCEEKKQCAHAEIQSKIDISKSGVIQNIVNAGFDLRKLGVAPEFGLQIKDEVSDRKFPQYTLDLHINEKDKKYHLHVYNSPEIGHAKSGVTIKLPQRMIALESSMSYPKDKIMPFPIRGELSLNMDKNKPGHKTSARFLVDMNLDNDRQQNAVAEFGFSHPQIDREALVKISGAMTRPEENTFKIETSASISHACLGRNREAKLLFMVSPSNFKFFVNTPLVKVIDLEGSATVQDKIQKGEFKMCLLEGDSIHMSALVKDFQYYELITSDSTNKFSVIGHLDPEKKVDLSADLTVSGQKRNLVHGSLFLDNNLLKTDYGASKDGFTMLVNSMKKEMENVNTHIKNLGEKAVNDFKATLQQVEPTLKKLQNAYTEDLNKFYQEITSDRDLQELSKVLHDVVQFVAQLLDDVIQNTKPLVDNITNTYIEAAKQIQEMFEKNIEPAIKATYDMIGEYVKAYLDALIDLVAQYTAIVTDFFEKHKPELQELTNTLTEIFKDLTRLLVAQLKELRVQAAQFCEDIAQQLKAMPIVDIIKERWAELAIPTDLQDLVNGAFNMLRPLLPTEETRDFADALSSYLLKKIRQDKCDDAKELRVVYQKFATAAMSIVQFVRTQASQIAGTPDPMSWLNSVWFGPAGLTAPTLGGEASFSLFKQILNGDLPDPLSMLKAYRPRSLNPLDEVPAMLRAVVVNGQHIFTFDGRHLTFPGTCRYVLVHDHVDRNFTLAMQLQNGQPKALVLEDKSGVTVELKDNGQVLLNGAAHGFPVIEKDIAAFKQANGRIGLSSNYGLRVFCTSKLEVCYVEVNGFYLGKLRGLLGDGNNEPYDDFRLPNGKICSSESEFGNAYRLSRSCAQAQGPAHSHHELHHAPLPAPCEEVFGGASPLKLLAPVLDIAPFRQACIHAVSGDSANGLHQACDLARGYAALAVTGMLPAVLPDCCVQCTDTDKPKNIGDTYEVKVPNKQADIIVTVETTTYNEKNYKDVVTPLVSQLVDMLKSKHISDIKVYLVGITSKFPYPIIYDTDLKLRNAKVAFDDKTRTDPIVSIKTGNEKLDQLQFQILDLYQGSKTGLGLTNVVGGYTSVLDLPLRPGAVKHAINVVGEQCTQPLFLLQAIREVIYSVIFDNMAYSHSLVTVTPNLKIGGGKNPANVVGYTEDSVLILGDKKHGKDSATLRATLENSNDACAEFVESTSGFVFSATNYKALNPGQQKHFLQTAATAITHKMLQETLVQQCTCTYVDPFRVRSVCVNKDRKEAARRRK